VRGASIAHIEAVGLAQNDVVLFHREQRGSEGKVIAAVLPAGLDRVQLFAVEAGLRLLALQAIDLGHLGRTEAGRAAEIQQRTLAGLPGQCDAWCDIVEGIDAVGGRETGSRQVPTSSVVLPSIIRLS
jgi:hypothetical protein